MSRIQFIDLPDIVLLEVFSYLSCEHALFAFADLTTTDRLYHLLVERGAFRQICLSSHINREQFCWLSNHIWRYDTVRSLVCTEMFSDIIAQLMPCPHFPSLTELRLLSMRLADDKLAPFIIAHSSTLTHLSVSMTELSSLVSDVQDFLDATLPHLRCLRCLFIDPSSDLLVGRSQLRGCLQSLEQLSTFQEALSDLYMLAEDGMLPSLQRLRVKIRNAVMRPLPNGDSSKLLRFAQLQRFDLGLAARNSPHEDEWPVEWSDVETLLLASVMPNLQQCSLTYRLATDDDIRHIARSSVFTDARRIRMQFVIHGSSASNHVVDETMLRDLHFGHDQNVIVDCDYCQSTPRYTVFTTSLPSWTICWIGHCRAVRGTKIARMGLSRTNVSLRSVLDRLRDTSALTLVRPASFVPDESFLVKPTALSCLRRMTIRHVVPGLELLLDGDILPSLRYIRASVVALFVALVRRPNPSKTFDSVEHLAILNELNQGDSGISLKQWHTVFYAFPRLTKLLVQFDCNRCPSMAMRDLFIDYIKRTYRTPLTLFSCGINDSTEETNKAVFAESLQKGIHEVFPLTFIFMINSTRLDAWL